MEIELEVHWSVVLDEPVGIFREIIVESSLLEAGNVLSPPVEFDGITSLATLGERST